ncbi:hypothetical protein H0H92_005246 [Tricholoma furcatifolium]|nr:hypothetical protein H0H92_005246 [Tricholoma furcatifolium]
MDLNNEAILRQLRVRYTAVVEGPQHNPTWTATALVGSDEYTNVVYGVGIGPTKSEAKEAASRVALTNLQLGGPRAKRENKTH